jgi:hypothetical protein
MSPPDSESQHAAAREDLSLSLSHARGLITQGEPVDKVCKETAPNSGIFTREWSKASVQMDCATWTPTIKMK